MASWSHLAGAITKGDSLKEKIEGATGLAYATTGC